MDIFYGGCGYYLSNELNKPIGYGLGGLIGVSKSRLLKNK